ncbi:MAG: neutral/alkaline non-lysosomal ceramidase N-terminal domain-containing protein, partial [Candidatus Paceibacterota bacterium]
MKLFIKFFVSIVLGIIFLFLIYALFNLRDRHRGYHIHIHRESREESMIHAGFSAISITPEIIDRWNDTLGNYQYNPDEGDTYEDINDSGNFDAVWMAGFQNSKPAQGVNDDLWARAMVLDDGHTRFAWVVLDAIGFNGDDIISVRKRIPAGLGIDYAIISSTHTHSAPDLIGLWGPSIFTSGVNPDYVEKVKKGALDAIELATHRLKPAYFRFSYDRDGATEMLADTREPIVINPIINVMQALDIETDSTLGTLITWDNHPETIWNKNLQITSDFPHYLRETVENGIRQEEELIVEGLGGTSIFAIGNIGGLMTTHPSVSIESFISGEVFLEPSFEKVKAQ